MFLTRSARRRSERQSDVPAADSGWQKKSRWQSYRNTNFLRLFLKDICLRYSLFLVFLTFSLIEIMMSRGEALEDKENSTTYHNNKAEAKEGRRSVGGGFSRLLSDVTNSIKLEHDEKLCQRIQNEMAAEHK